MTTEHVLAFKEATHEMIDDMVKSLSEEFSDREINSALAHRSILIYCMNERIAFTDITLMNKAITLLLRRSQNLNEEGHYVVKELREALDGLPDDMPVLIEKLGDGWRTEQVVFDSIPLNNKQVASLSEQERHLVFKNAGRQLLKVMQPAAHAFGHAVTEDAAGKKLLLVYASY